MIQSLKTNITKQLIKYAVQRQMVCPQTHNILDCRTAIMIEVNDLDGKGLATHVISPAALPDLKKLDDRIKARITNCTTVYTTANKKLKNKVNSELLTII
jgi:hypothetical protein